MTDSEPVAWMVTNIDGQDAYVTADPALAQRGQRALPLYTAPVMDTCANVRSSRPTGGGGFVQCDKSDDLAALRKDAERYRKWRLEYTNHDTEPMSEMLLDLADAYTSQEVDAAIDAAMAQPKEL